MTERITAVVQTSVLSRRLLAWIRAQLAWAALQLAGGWVLGRAIHLL
jgi:hypothetical protein